MTTRDVTVSAAIWFTQSTAQPYNLAAVKVINSKTVQFTQTAGSHNNQFEPGVLQAPNVIVPASVYGRLLPPDIWRIIDASLRPGHAAAAGPGPVADYLRLLTEVDPGDDPVVLPPLVTVVAQAPGS